jgi:2-dehydro-3-deoxyphosphogluconate aldolase/(4S)-4-hydroxy-2-oxoglutarate aldolase
VQGARLAPPPGPIIAILRGHAPEAVQRIVDGLVDGGVTTVEVTLDSPHALRSIVALDDRGDVIVGAGTVMDATGAEAAIDAGAAFLVAPDVNRAVIAAALDRGVPMLPGALTPTEIATAWEAGAAAVKLFPAVPLGPAYVAAMRGPLAGIPLVPTGGIDDANAAAFMAAGAVALGVGGWLTNDPDPAVVAERAGRLRAAVA